MAMLKDRKGMNAFRGAGLCDDNAIGYYEWETPMGCLCCFSGWGNSGGIGQANGKVDKIAHSRWNACEAQFNAELLPKAATVLHETPKCCGCCLGWKQIEENINGEWCSEANTLLNQHGFEVKAAYYSITLGESTDHRLFLVIYLLKEAAI